jgi:hypothetical protein
MQLSCFKQSDLAKHTTASGSCSLVRCDRRQRCSARVAVAAGRHQQQQQQQQTSRALHRYDLLGLSNLCVDVVVNVDELPGPDKDDRLRILHKVPQADSLQSADSLERLDFGSAC